MYAHGMNDIACKFPWKDGEIISSWLHHCTFSAEHNRNGLHMHDCYEVCIVLNGTGIFCQNGKEHPIEEDCIFVGDPYLVHEIIADKETDLTLAFFTFTYHGEGGDGFFAGHETVARDCAHIAPYFYMITSYRYAGASAALPKLMELMISDTLSALTEPAAPGGRKLASLEKYILSRRGEKIYASELAKFLGLSERSLYYYFSEKLNSTPSEFIGRTRINAACEYLQMGFTVSAASSACGFSDLSSFSRLFRKHKGISPREYAEKYVTLRR